MSLADKVHMFSLFIGAPGLKHFITPQLFSAALSICHTPRKMSLVLSFGEQTQLNIYPNRIKETWKMEIKPLQFEIMIDRLEKASSNQVLYLVKMSLVLTFHLTSSPPPHAGHPS